MILSLAQLGWFTLALLLYRCLLYPTGWFRANRWYLLFIVPLALALPGIAQFFPDLPKFSFNSPITPVPEVEILANEVARFDMSGEASTAPFPADDFQVIEGPISAPRPSLTTYWFYGYLLVVLALLLKLIWSHWKIFKTIQHRLPLPMSEQSTNDTPWIKGFLLPEGKNLAFTYWTCYFVSPDQLPQDGWQHIQRHEAAHASGLHTADLLLADLFVAFCWYFPPAWYYRHLLRSNLEFLADRQAISQANCRKNYLQTLIQTAQLRDGGPAFAFSAHPLKNRIMMLQTKALSFWQFATRSVLTALLLCLLAISCTESLDEVITPTPTTSHDSYEFYLTAFPSHQDLILLQAALEEIGAELFVSLRDGQFTHLKVTYGKLGDREQLGGLAETCTPIRLTFDPAANLCQFNYHQSSR